LEKNRYKDFWIKKKQICATNLKKLQICGIIFTYFTRKEATDMYMNRKHWLTILLNGSVNDDEIYNLLDMSYEMTECAWKAHDGQQPD